MSALTNTQDPSGAYQVQCRHFNGYKPCTRNTSCDASCPAKEIIRLSILVVHLGALGAVVRSTANLKAIKRKYPGAMITFVTDAPAHHLLQGHPGIDRVLTTQEADILQLSALQFEIAFVIDKSLKAIGLLQRTRVDKVYGFMAHPQSGAIVPATSAARELWELGLNNHTKFFVNQKPETQLMIEALELGPYLRDEYWLPLRSSEVESMLRRRQDYLSASGKTILIGLNTGCSDVIAYKKLSVQTHRQLIAKIQTEIPTAQIVLLGGPEDRLRNDEIAEGLAVIKTPTDQGLRDGLISVAACDVVVTGDSLGMHMAISQKKNVIAWFGPTCAQEIDLFERGVKIVSKVPCSPCWKRTCDMTSMCYDQVSVEEIIDAIKSCSANCLSGGLAVVDPTFEKVPTTVASA